MKKTKNMSNARFYIALCCCVLVIALVGYVGRKANRQNNPDQEVAQVVEAEESPIPTFAPPSTAPTKPSIAPATAAPKKAQTVSKTVETEEAPAAQTSADKPTFAAPLAGKVAEGFSGDKLIYNNALSDWRTHDGIDIACTAGTDVHPAAAGTITEVYDDVRGGCVAVDHKNGYTTLYAGLGDVSALSVGQELAADSVLGKTADKISGENVTEPHLHFELMHDGENVNPTDFIQFAE